MKEYHGTWRNNYKPNWETSEKQDDLPCPTEVTDDICDLIHEVKVIINGQRYNLS